MLRHETNEVLPLLGEEVDRYRVIAELAHGGMAAVYVVHRKTAGFDKLFAMKVMLPHLRSDEKFSAMFLDEAQIGSKVQHPNVVQIFDVGDRYGSPFMVMELLRGKSLSYLMKARAKGRVFLSRGLLFWILARVADGLHAAHTATGHDGQPLHVIHRDVSFQNIHVGYDGQVKVVDFGIADAEGRVSKTRTGEVLGKLQFMAPEQFHRKHAIDRRVDIWALGVVAWRALSGTRLFRGKTDAETMWNVVHGEVPDLAAACKEPLPPGIAQMVMSCLSHDPSQRPATAAKFAEVFQQAAMQERGSTDELALFMENAFSDSKRAEEHALAEAIADPHRVSENTVLRAMSGLSSGDGSQSVSAPDVEQIAPTKSGPSKKLVIGMALLSAGAVASIVALLASDDGSKYSTSTDQSASNTAAMATAESAQTKVESQDTPKEEASKSPTAATPQEVTLRLDGEVRMALVDGIRHDERPLVILLQESEKANVTVLTSDGEQAWTIGVNDDGRILKLAPKATPTVVTEETETASPAEKAPAKPAAKKPAAKKPAVKKPAVKKPAVKKPRPKKKPTKKPGGGLIEVPL